MLRKIIQINEMKCNGCGICAAACHEGAIGMVNGKAKLLRDDYCDGLGDCLPVCPVEAISFVEREAAAYDEKAVLENQRQTALNEKKYMEGDCPGRQARQIPRPSSESVSLAAASALRQWPVQIQLAPIHAPYFHDAHLLVAADCAAYAYADFHQAYMRERITLIGCPKLDSIEYREKLTAILRENAIRSVMVARMEVPCCGGLERAVKQSCVQSGKALFLEVVTISTDGKILACDSLQQRF